MKRVWYLLWICVCAAALVLSGCRASNFGADGSTAGESGAPSEATQSTETSQPTVGVTLPDHSLIIPDGQSDLALGKTGIIRLEYTGNLSSVRYITSAEEIAEYDALKAYDTAFFREHALILVVETVTTGNTDIEISGVRLDGTEATVTLSHQISGDASIAVMTTWLLWAEVEAGLDYHWSVANSSAAPDAERY